MLWYALLCYAILPQFRTLRQQLQAREYHTSHAEAEVQDFPEGSRGPLEFLFP